MCRARAVFLLVAAILAVSAGASGVVPGVKTTVSAAGARYVLTSIVVPELEYVINNKLVIPSITKEVPSLMGPINVTLSGVKMSGFSFDQDTLTLLSNEGFAFQLVGATGQIDLSWSYSQDWWPHISDHGTGTAVIKKMEMAVVVQLGVTADNHLTVAATSVSFDIGDLDITLHGGASWFYQIFIDLFTWLVDDIINDAVEKAVGTVVSDINNELAVMPVAVAIGNTSLAIDYSFSSPVITPEYMSFGVNGEVYDWHNGSSSVYTCSTMPDTVTGEMAEVFVNQYVLDTAGYSLYETGKLSAALGYYDVPAKYQEVFYTDFYKLILTPLYRAFPHMPLLFRLSDEAPPVTTFGNNNLTFTVTGRIDCEVINSDNSTTQAFSLDAVVDLDTEVVLQGTNLTFTFDVLAIKMTVAQSSIGSFDVTLIEMAINTVLDIAVALLNESALHNGIPLPTGFKGLQFSNPDILIATDYLYISSDLVYVAPTLL
eukprot:TRINITY_DN18031_c0_g1_i1.p1 TRINITY_DN18031_c0_g1~~TRINITY_DN18031_c0_g1_i1.p1  ORF type:complete len:486 (-),score=129.10 TRINITY_DN18031_c0_g1_i1:99-1556(-)